MSAFKKLILAAAAFGLTFTPVLASAQVSGRSTTSEPANFCDRITNVREDVSSKLNGLESDRAKSRTDILAKLKDRKGDREDDVEKMRDDAKQKFEDAIKKIEAEATTDAQIAALAEFKASVKVSQDTRKLAVDAAVKTFRSGVESLVGKRSDAIKAAAATLKSSILAAVAKAKADCVSGDPVTVRATLMASIQASLVDFRTVSQAVDKIGQQIKDLAATRNASIKAANQAFKASVEQARKTLKAAFPKA